MERVIEAFAREPSGGLLVPPDVTITTHRNFLTALAARHRLPAIYSDRVLSRTPCGTRFRSPAPAPARRPRPIRSCSTVISGYSGSTQGMLAMERGEVDGALTSWHTLNRTRQDWLRWGDLNLLVQYAPQQHRDLPGVPTALDIAPTPEAKAIFAFYISGAQVGRSIMAPPGLPAERTKILRSAFDAMPKDPELLAEVEKIQLEFQPACGGELQKLVEAAAGAPPEVIERTNAIMRGKREGRTS